jgi:methanogenic corrinoid protein MtbC1
MNFSSNTSSQSSSSSSSNTAGPVTPALRLAQSASSLLQAYFEPLLDGDRYGARKLIDNALASGTSPYELLTELVWPAMEKIQADFKADALSVAQVNLATRLNRFVADMLGARLQQSPVNGKRVLVFCGNAEPEELGGQICADLFQSAGFEAKFAGGGVPEDEVLRLIGDFRPDLLLMFATLPSAVPQVRKLIDYLREVNANPDMQVMCCGGIYKRAEGLAEEIGADLYAPDAATALEVATSQPGRRASVDQQTVGRSRRMRKTATQRRGPAVLGRIAPRPGGENGIDRRQAI